MIRMFTGYNYTGEQVSQPYTDAQVLQGKVMNTQSQNSYGGLHLSNGFETLNTYIFTSGPGYIGKYFTEGTINL